ncbi:hypothetical protein JIG36_34305 [Actinoplanes sp. LDG1-06]|uniref:Uncharacterized protein n=1 Tax=Paractinoplanes ovalisporus TaxID=2810368 RepID=A0ABS2AL89_9ACTN|nr:hypothetical protein [Actinoplanes ovalisporus]MBM2620587.1 hypothetical protein [Actinoplanes ovalisporus]
MTFEDRKLTELDDALRELGAHARVTHTRAELDSVYEAVLARVAPVEEPQTPAVPRPRGRETPRPSRSRSGWLGGVGLLGVVALTVAVVAVPRPFVLDSHLAGRPPVPPVASSLPQAAPVSRAPVAGTTRPPQHEVSSPLRSDAGPVSAPQPTPSSFPEPAVTSTRTRDVETERPITALTRVSVALGAATVSPAPQKATCAEGLTMTFVQPVSLNEPGRLTYRWLRSDQAIAPDKHLDFMSAGTQAITTTWQRWGEAGEVIDGWQQLEVLAPDAQKGERITFREVCPANG